MWGSIGLWAAGSRLSLLASSSICGLTAIGGGMVALAGGPGIPPPKTYTVSGSKGSVAYNPQGVGGGNGQYNYRNGGNAGLGPQLTVNFSAAKVVGQMTAPTVSISSSGGNGGNGYSPQYDA